MMRWGLSIAALGIVLAMLVVSWRRAAYHDRMATLKDEMRERTARWRVG